MISSVTLLFPGQGSQYVGMGKNLCELDPSLNQYFDTADNVLSFSLKTICLEGPKEMLTLTANAQPAILTHSIMLLHKLRNLLNKYHCPIELVLGHSVGEYAALVASEALAFSDAVKALHLRGKFMQEAVPQGIGKMFAILNASEDLVIEACSLASKSNPSSVVMPANFNSPQQIVISGHGDACERAIAWLHSHSPEKVRSLELQVSAPFHSSLMEPAATRMQNELDKISFKRNTISYVANKDALIYKEGTDPSIMKKNLVEQICGSVLWTQSVAHIPQTSLCLEVGPGQVLKNLIKKINPSLKVIALDTQNSFEELEELLK